MEPLSLHPSALDRRGFLSLAGLAGLSWLTPVGHLLARAAEAPGKGRRPAQSIIVLWLAGGPSQLETFDPHPGTNIAGGTGAIKTSVKGIQLATGLERTADQMQSIALVRSLVSKEGDHERGTYTMKTGFRPDPTVIRPSIGAICCHELPAGETDIPRHVSILPDQWAARGGYLGAGYDAFKMDDPAGEVPDTKSHVSPTRDEQRLKHLDVVERAFRRGRRRSVEATLHRKTVARARKMMSSEQLKAFDVSKEPLSVRRAYGETPFGRGCLAARRLIEVGVRCVEVTLGGWDTHANNHALTRKLVNVLDPALSGLVRDLRTRGLLDRTVVLCMGEFGRTPVINPLGGRDHWPNGFSVALAGGGIKGGQVIGATDPKGKPKPVKPVKVGDLHATVLTAVGIDPEKVNRTPIGRTAKLAEGKVIAGLLAKG
jgi:hypothetical protein